MSKPKGKRHIKREEIVGPVPPGISTDNENNYKLKDGFQRVWAMYHIFTSMIFDIMHRNPKDYWTRKY